MSIRVCCRSTTGLLIRKQTGLLIRKPSPSRHLPLALVIRLKSNGSAQHTSGKGGDYVIIGAKKETPSKPLELHGVAPKPKPDSEKLQREIVQRIKFSGPLTVQQYMQEVLSNPLTGYYMGKDVFGAGGDFVTSPEISQMFGECLAVWLAHEWMKMGAPKPLQLVEMGPGRGTLMSDILRVFSKLVPNDMAEIQVHLVETSPMMKSLQEMKLCSRTSSGDGPKLSKYGCSKIYWHHRLEQVPKEFSFFVAHEFFDALPIHKFVRIPGNEDKASKEWREILVDVDMDQKEGGERLRFVRARHQTPALSLIPKEVTDDVDALEVCPKAGAIVKSISERIDEFGGAALIADYGKDAPASDSFRGFRSHALHDVLSEPGTADLTADVDFSYLKTNCSEHTLAYGPVEQGHFLRSLGIEHRLQKLTENSNGNAKVKDQLTSAFQMLVSPDQMGARFKFLSIFPKTMQHIHQKFPPAGFHPPPPSPQTAPDKASE